eukprot:2570086-Pyramimonas_sp.AAC.2
MATTSATLQLTAACCVVYLSGLADEVRSLNFDFAWRAGYYTFSSEVVDHMIVLHTQSVTLSHSLCLEEPSAEIHAGVLLCNRSSRILCCFMLLGTSSTAAYCGHVIVPFSKPRLDCKHKQSSQHKVYGLFHPDNRFSFRRIPPL